MNEEYNSDSSGTFAKVSWINIIRDVRNAMRGPAGSEGVSLQEAKDAVVAEMDAYWDSRRRFFGYEATQITNSAIARLKKDKNMEDGREHGQVSYIQAIKEAREQVNALNETGIYFGLREAKNAVVAEVNENYNGVQYLWPSEKDAIVAAVVQKFKDDNIVEGIPQPVWNVLMSGVIGLIERDGRTAAYDQALLFLLDQPR